MQNYFTFEHPEWLWALLMVPGLFLMAAYFVQWKKKAITDMGAIERNTIIPFAPRTWLRISLLAITLAFLAIAAANPQKGMKKNTESQQSADVIIALDISQSMLAEDTKPSRLLLAKSFAQKLIKSLAGERVGLIFFAGTAFMQSPLSDDHNFLLRTLDEASPELISTQGTALPEAIALARRSFDDADGKSGGRALILISDGENHGEDAKDAAREAFDDGMVIYTVGVGTEQGAPIPLGNIQGMYKRDENNEIVHTKANFEELQRLAGAGGGRAYRLKQQDATLKGLKNEINNLEKRKIQVRSGSEMESWYQWFLLPAFLLLLLEWYVSVFRLSFKKSSPKL
jgi:Ca-activated chloride channel homolog